MKRPALGERLTNGPPILLDGPTGTELERKGCDTTGPLWSTRVVLDRPDAVRLVHAAYVEAGADLLTAVTFRAHRRAFEEAGQGEQAWQDAVVKAVALAREAAEKGSRPVWVAGSLAPLGDCYAPLEVPPQNVVVREHRAQADRLAEAGVDLILVETMNTGREAVAAAEAARRTGLPVFVALIVTRGGHLLSGEPLGPVLAAIRPHADALLVNCSTLSATSEALPLLQRGGLPWGAYANGGTEEPDAASAPGRTVDPFAFGAAAKEWLQAGARIVGSCCGTGPEHTALLRQVLQNG